MATSKFGTGFPIYAAQGRVISQVSDRQVTNHLRVTRIIAGKNQPIGGTNEDGSPRTKLMTVRVDFKNLTDDQVAKLTVGSLIAFDGELMEERFQAGDDWISFNTIEAWSFQRVAASKAERTANRPPAAPVMQQFPTVVGQDDTIHYDEIEF